MFKYRKENEKMKIAYNLDLELCTDIKSLDEFFVYANITELEDQFNYLADYMGIIGTRPCGEITLEDECKMIKELFISGKWMRGTRMHSDNDDV